MPRDETTLIDYVIHRACQFSVSRPSICVCVCDTNFVGEMVQENSMIILVLPTPKTIVRLRGIYVSATKRVSQIRRWMSKGTTAQNSGYWLLVAGYFFLLGGPGFCGGMFGASGTVISSALQ